MANTHGTLTALFTAIANAIRGKTGSADPIVADSFPEAIDGISTGVDTSDATATAANIEDGFTAYVQGVKVEGSLPVEDRELWISSGNVFAVSTKTGEGVVSHIGAGIDGKNNPIPDTLVKQGSDLYILGPAANYGNATAEDVAAGKTFTSAAGLKVVGTRTT